MQKKRIDMKLGQILIERFSISPAQIEEALKKQAGSRQPIGEILVEMGAIDEHMLCRALSLQLGIPFFPTLEDSKLDLSLLRKIPISYARKNHVFPLFKENGEVLVAVANPLDWQSFDEVASLLGVPARRVIVPADEISKAINRHYDQGIDTAEQMVQSMVGEDSDRLLHELEETKDILDATDEAPIIRLINLILFQAVKANASDIHIEPFERDLQVRYRIDGILYPQLSLPKRHHSAITSRVKIMAKMDIAEKRLPQDGRIRIRAADRDIDIRVSTVPTQFGERVVMRLLDRSNVLLRLEDLGLFPDHLEMMNRLIKLSHGIVLVTGPTGSGKTTTLYAALSKINSPDKNIITIEDPVEYQLRGIGQIQVNPKIDLTFASGLRSIVRQDPDVILVGEIRDLETAEIAIHAALTGHLVFSTLHTNDAAGAITRLIDMGIEPFLVSSSVNAIVAQRLVRLVCPECKMPFKPDDESLKQVEIDPEKIKGKELYRGSGCDYCMHTGYKGRTGIYEILIVDDRIRPLIMRNADSNEIKRAAVSAGMITLREDGVRKVIDGLTTIEEVIRVTQD